MNKRIISLMLTVAVALTAAVTASAAANIDNENWGNNWDERYAKKYTLGSAYESAPLSEDNNPLTNNYNNHLFTFTLDKETDITVSLTSRNAKTDYFLYSVDRGWLTPSSRDTVFGSAHDNNIEWNSGAEKARASIQYNYVQKGRYVFGLKRGSGVTERGPDGLPSFEFTITDNQSSEVSPNSVPPLPPAAAPPFAAGSVAQNVSAVLSGGSIYINWDAVNAAKYAVYVMYTGRDGEVYGNWTTGMSDYNSYVILRPVKNVMYHITVLPYSDVPYRQYGGFSPYARVLT